MPDSPDYSKYLTGNVRFSLQDLGEMAARLGSPHSFDRRGNLVWFDCFNSGLNNWVTGGDGTGNAVNLSASNVYRWPYVANLLAGTTGTKSANLSKYFGAQSLLRGGVEVVLSTPIQYNFIQIEKRVVVGSINYRMICRLNYSPATISVFDETFTEVVISSIDNPVSALPIYRNLKFVWDTSRENWVRVILAGEEYNVSNIGVYQESASGDPDAVLIFSVFGLASPQASVNLASALVTADEP